MKKLSEKVEYKKFKMESIGTIVQLVKAGVFISKLDIKDAYNIRIYESEQKYLEFQFDRFLYKCTALPDGYTEGPIKPIRLLKPPLAWLRRAKKIVIARYFDKLITIKSFYAPCLRNIAKIIRLPIALGFVIHS